jgi:hypothetical protein
MRILLVGALLAAGCTGKQPIRQQDEDRAKDAAPTATPGSRRGPDPQAANRPPSEKSAFGPQCQRFFDHVDSKCTSTQPAADCEQMQHRITELRRLPPGEDGTMGRYEVLCIGELDKLPVQPGR